MASTTNTDGMNAIQLAYAIKLLSESLVLNIQVAEYLPRKDQIDVAEKAISDFLAFIHKHRPKVERVPTPGSITIIAPAITINSPQAVELKLKVSEMK